MFIEKYQEGKNQAWRYMIGFIAIIVAILLGQIPMGISLVVLKEFDPVYAADLQNALTKITTQGISSNVLFFFNLVPFVFAFIAVFLVVKYFLERPMLSVATGRAKFDFFKLGSVALIWLILNVVLEFIFYLIYPENYEFSLNLHQFIPLLFITILLVPIQSATEELIIRGYLLQAFGGLLKYRWLAVLLTAVIFASLHLDNPEFEKFGLSIGTYYLVFGLVAAIIAIIDDGLEIPIAMHAMNNVYGAIFVSFKGSVFSTATIFKVNRMEISTMLIGWFVMLSLFIFIMQMRYKWKNWDVIFKKIVEK
jgi:membrane protease YdiL (CAAX protease family)